MHSLAYLFQSVDPAVSGRILGCVVINLYGRNVQSYCNDISGYLYHVKECSII